jgi:hypothetical protein
MTKIGKLLAIFLAIGSLAFAGFAIATTFGGPDWSAMMQAEYFREYKIVRGGAPDYLWTANRGVDDQQIASSKKLPEVLTKVMDDVLTRQQQQLQTLTEREPQLQARIDLLERSIAADQQALDAELVLQRERLAAVRKQEADTAIEVVAATNEAQKLENLIAARREDVLRLRQLVEEIRADQFRLEAIQAQLKNLLIQLQGDAARANLREKMLSRQPGPAVGTQAVSTGGAGQ